MTEIVPSQRALVRPVGIAGPDANRGVIDNIQTLRAFAAFIVVVLHATIMCGKYGYSDAMYAWIAGWGWQGVDLFFVISGFVMVLTQHRKNRSPQAFILERILRIAPIYWLLTIVLFLGLWAVPGFFKELTGETSRFVHSMTFTTIYTVTPTFHRYPLVWVGWTLDYEMFFYVIFAFCIPLRTMVARIGVQLAVMLAMIAFTPMEPLCLEFIMGELLALFYINGPKIDAVPALGLCVFGLLGLAVTAPFGRPFQDWLVDYRLVGVAIPALMLVAGALYAQQVKHPLLELLGNASYSIYLIQIFTLSFVYKAASILLPGISGYLVAAVAIALSLVAGVIFHLIVEKPLTQLLKRQTAELRWVSAPA